MASILIIDDDVPLAQTLQKLLTAAGYAASYEITGEAGYASIRKNNPSLILMDVMMGYETEGLDLARRLKTEPKTKHIPIVALTGMRTALGIESAPKPDKNWFPVDRMLEKPVKPELLLSTVKQCLNS